MWSQDTYARAGVACARLPMPYVRKAPLRFPTITCEVRCSWLTARAKSVTPSPKTSLKTASPRSRTVPPSYRALSRALVDMLDAIKDARTPE